MLNPKIKFNPKIFSEGIERISPRDGFGEGLSLIGEMDKRVVALCADVTESLRMHLFKNRFPERFFEVGIAEQNLIGVASGLAAVGKIPVVGSYAVFSPGRNWEQIRTAICYNEQKVILVGSHAGLNVGPDGASHQGLEDIGLMRVLPKMSVVSPADSLEARKAIISAVEYPGPVYIRLPRGKTPVFTTEQTPFEITKSQVLWFPPDMDEDLGSERHNLITVFASGCLVYEALEAAKELEEEGIFTTIINNSAIKPLDEELVLKWAKKSKAIITLEEHQVATGMGSAIAEFLSENYPLSIKFMGTKDQFGESGEAEELIEKYGLGKKMIKQAIKDLIKQTKTSQIASMARKTM
ncbi:MAG: transketolase C-terminal domain-containing protein [Candidatus Pacebacteria bacterium]|nr:transketolase C-terminal domain-containing protein [Candidatus Paceibacterota bacterium]